MPIIKQYGEAYPFFPSGVDLPDVAPHIRATLVKQMQAVLDDPVRQYCESSMWNQRIWDYLVDTAVIVYRPN